MLDYKDAIMASATPKCHRDRLSADVNDASGRESVFAAAGHGSTLMITEGLLMYLPAATIEALAATASVSYWMLDAASAEMSRRVRMDQYESIENVRAADHLDGLQILGVLDRHGWIGLRRFGYGTDVMQFAAERVMAIFRNLPPDQFPKRLPPSDPSGVHLFGRPLTGTVLQTASPSMWARLATCAAVGYRRRSDDDARGTLWVGADCQSAAACQAAPHGGKPQTEIGVPPRVYVVGCPNPQRRNQGETPCNSLSPNSIKRSKV